MELQSPPTYRQARKPRAADNDLIAVTVQETQRLTGLGKTKVWELIAQKKLRTVAVGRRRLVLYACGSSRICSTEINNPCVARLRAQGLLRFVG
jgi:excisionase family DNA binding protein